jgi:hypothetical protein
VVSLYKRATPPQAKVLRMIEGAVKNAADAHPGVTVSGTFARSVAKRAAGTLTAQWPDVLAARCRVPSERAGADSPAIRSVRCCAQIVKDGNRGGRRTSLRRSPLSRRFRIELGILAREARRVGNADRETAFVEALRLLAKFEPVE